MARVFLLLVLLAVAFKQGAGIKCYMCSSVVNENCGDPIDTNQLETVDCSMDGAKNFLNKIDKTFSGFAQKIGLGDMFPEGAGSVEMACQKMKYTENGKEVVMRACILEDSVGICSDKTSSKEGLFCEQCKADACNGADQLGVLSLLYLLVPCIVAVLTLGF